MPAVTHCKVESFQLQGETGRPLAEAKGVGLVEQSKQLPEQS